MPPEVQLSIDRGDVALDRLDEALVRRAVESAVAAGLGAGGDPLRDRLASSGALEISVRITGDADMRELNRSYRGVDKSTDVLSFSLVEEGDGPAIVTPESWPVQLGDVVISYPQVVQQARELGHSTDKELTWLLIHGTLQLLGYTHDTDAAANRMETLERQVLATLGLIER